MNSNDDAPIEKPPLFSGALLPVFYLRLVEALSVEHQGNPTAIERALHTLGKTMATPLILGLVSRYGKPPNAFFPSAPDVFLNRVDEYLLKNWELAAGTPPDSLEFKDDRTLILRAESCPICSQDTFVTNLDLRYCELVSGMLEGLLQHWIDHLELDYLARVTQLAGHLQGAASCEFRIHFAQRTS